MSTHRYKTDCRIKLVRVRTGPYLQQAGRVEPQQAPGKPGLSAVGTSAETEALGAAGGALRSQAECSVFALVTLLADDVDLK